MADFQHWYDEGQRALERLRGADHAAELRGDLETALAAFDEAQALSPNHPGVLRERALILAQLLDHGAAVDAFVAAVSLAPGDVDLRLAAARSLSVLGQHDAALAAFDEVLRRSEGNVGALFGRATSLAALRQDERAVAAWDQWLSTNAPARVLLAGESFRQVPHELVRPAALVSRACALARLGRPEALGAFREVFTAGRWMTRDHFTEALRTLEVARAAYRAHVEAHAAFTKTLEEAGHTWRAAGQLNEALAAWDTVVLRAPSAQAWEGKGACHESLGQLDAAIAAYEASLALWSEFRPAAQGLQRAREARAPRTGPWTVMGRDTFAREDFVVGSFATRADAEACLARQDASASAQDDGLRDSCWLVAPRG